MGIAEQHAGAGACGKNKIERIDKMKSLLYSRKFWLAVFGIVQTLVFHFLPNFPAEVWAAIDALVIVLIGSIALEDAAEKRAG